MNFSLPKNVMQGKFNQFQVPIFISPGKVKKILLIISIHNFLQYRVLNYFIRHKSFKNQFTKEEIQNISMERIFLFQNTPSIDAIALQNVNAAPKLEI